MRYICSSLKFVFLPRIKRGLSIFQEAWNNHGIRTMNHRSPRQLFVSGTLRLRHSGLVSLDFLNNVNGDTYGVSDDHESLGSPSNSVEVPPSRIRVSPEQLELLQAQVDPLSSSDNFGIDKYERTVELLEEWLG